MWDEQTREVFTPEAWHERRLGFWDGDIPKVATQTTIHIYQHGTFERAITLGMAKTGLPDVVVSDFTEGPQGIKLETSSIRSAKLWRKVRMFPFRESAN